MVLSNIHAGCALKEYAAGKTFSNAQPGYFKSLSLFGIKPAWHVPHSSKYRLKYVTCMPNKNNYWQWVGIEKARQCMANSASFIKISVSQMIINETSKNQQTLYRNKGDT